MPKQPLTATGVQDKLAELYALSDTQLAQEASALATDFLGWIDNHFNLTTAQNSYLSGVSADFITLAAAQTSFAIKYRRNITFNPSAPPGSWSSKLIRSSSSLVATDSNTTGMSSSGSLSFEVVYI